MATNELSRMSEMAEPAKLDALGHDARKPASMMREMRDQVGADDFPGEFDQGVDRLEKGQSPEDIERDLPDLASPTTPEID
mgnify:CR=1 FL=1